MDDIEVIDYYENDESNDIIKPDTYNNYYDIMKNYDVMKMNYKSSNRLNKYEKAKILGIRAQQLAMNAKSLIVIPKYITNHLERAEYELKEKQIPFIIKRTKCDLVEYWKLEDMIIS